MLFQAHFQTNRLLLFFLLTAAFPFQDKHVFSPWLVRFIIMKRFSQGSGEYGLKFLRQLPAQGDPPISQRLMQAVKRPDQVMGRLIKDDRTGLLLQLLQHGPELFFIIKGKKAFKTESPGRKPGQGQRRNAGGRSGKRGYRDPGLLAHSDQHLAGIRNGGRSRVRDQGDILSLLQKADELLSFFHPVIFMIAGHRRMYVKMIQKPDTVSGILRRDQIHIPQSFRRPRRHILQIPDRRGAQIKRSCHFPSMSMSRPFPPGRTLMSRLSRTLRLPQTAPLLQAARLPYIGLPRSTGSIPHSPRRKRPGSEPGSPPAHRKYARPPTSP